MRREQKYVALIVVLALLLAACTSDGATTTTGSATQSTDPVGVDTKEMMDATLGTQAVQDFVVYLDMATASDAGPVSFYHEVIDEAAIGLGAPIDLGTVFTLNPVQSLSAQVLDSSGNVLPSISVDFGLMTPTATAADEASQKLLEQVGDDPDLQFLTEDSDGAGAALLVEIVSADLAVMRTHVGPGDVSGLDLGFVGELSADDEIISTYVFGQTYPGDPALEAGLDPIELFTYRWSVGLVSFLADYAGGPMVYSDSVDPAAESEPELKTPQVQQVSFSENPNSITLAQETETTTIQPDESGNLSPKAKIELKLAIAKVAAGLVGTSNALSNFNDLSKLKELREIEVDGFPIVLQIEPDRVDILLVLDEDVCFLSRKVIDTIEKDPVKGFPNSESGDKRGSYPKSECQNVKERVNALRFNPDTNVFEYDKGAKFRIGSLAPDQVLPFLILAEQTKLCYLAAEEALLQNGLPIDGVEGVVPSPSAFCSPPDKPDPDAPTAGTYSDVHLRTFDGWDYDNQATGEFLVYDDGDATVQMRLGPWEDSEVASVLKAVAVGTEGHHLSMHTGGGLWLDGVPTELARGEHISVGTAGLTWTGLGWVMVWPDGTKIGVSDFNGRMGLFVTSSGTPAVGMLGSPDGDPSNDWVTRGGEILDPEIRFDFDAFYPTYVDTWRITQDESLFYYQPGETTETFTIAGFPRSQFAVGDFDPAVVEDAEEVCVGGGIEDPAMLEDCIMDVVVTGDRSFAYDIYQAQSFTSQPSPNTTVAGNPPDVAGDTYVTVGAFALEFGANPPQLAPNSFTPKWICLSDNGMFHAENSFQDAQGRQFDLLVDFIAADASPVGQPGFFLVVKLNGEEYAWYRPWEDNLAWTFSGELAGSPPVLRVTGTAFLNDPLVPNLYDNPLPPGTQLEPFALEASC